MATSTLHGLALENLPIVGSSGWSDSAEGVARLAEPAPGRWC